MNEERDREEEYTDCGRTDTGKERKGKERTQRVTDIDYLLECLLAVCSTEEGTTNERTKNKIK